jgi:hypothetical protein
MLTVALMGLSGISITRSPPSDADRALFQLDIAL